jgi:SAM-dependent methyltransferase
MSTESHRDQILDQFTRQAVPFSTAPGVKDEQALRLVTEFSGAGPDDTVLDVACGPGILACAFAQVARHVTGIDLTPAMLDRARTLAAEKGLTNITWQHGDVLPLPYPNGSFTIVTARFAFHHFLDPGAVLAEMRRVQRPGRPRGRHRQLAGRRQPTPSTGWSGSATPRTCAPRPSRSTSPSTGRSAWPSRAVTWYRLKATWRAHQALRSPIPATTSRSARCSGASLVDGDSLGIQARREGRSHHLRLPGGRASSRAVTIPRPLRAHNR